MQALLLVWPWKVTLRKMACPDGRLSGRRTTTCVNQSKPGTLPANSTVNGNTLPAPSCACATTADVFSFGARSRFVTKNITRVRLSLLRFHGLVNENGSRTIVGDSSAMATSVFVSVAITGGGGVGLVN